MRYPHDHKNQLLQYIDELENCAASLDEDLNKADELITKIRGDFGGMPLQVYCDQKNALLIPGKKLGELLGMLAQEMRRANEAYESIEDEISSAFRI